MSQSPSTSSTSSNPASLSASSIDTKSVAGRRQLRFETLEQMLADVDRLVEAERAGRLRCLGNWTLGQTLGHLATWAEYAYTGVPISAPFFIRWYIRLRKNHFLYGTMRPGVKIPRVRGGTLGIDPIPLEEGLRRFRQITERIAKEPPSEPSPIFGQLNLQESIALKLRHAELHLSFLVPEKAPVA